MATQLQRALGLADGKEAVPKKTEQAERPRRREGGDKKGGEKGDPYPNLPRRPMGRD